MTETIPLKKIDGIYHTPVHANGRTKWISTGCDTKAEATKVLAESGVERLNAVAKAGRLSTRAIGQILTGKHLTCLKALEKYQKLKSVSRSSKTIANHLIVISNWMKEAKVEAVPPSAVIPKHIGKWINDPELTWKRSTRQVALSSVRDFFGFCSDQGWIVSDPSRLVELSWCDQNRTGPCDQKRNNAVGLLSERICSISSSVASAEDRALRGRNLSVG